MNEATEQENVLAEYETRLGIEAMAAAVVRACRTEGVPYLRKTIAFLEEAAAKPQAKASSVRLATMLDALYKLQDEIDPQRDLLPKTILIDGDVVPEFAPPERERYP